MENSFLYDSLNKLNSSEIVERIKMGSYADDAKEVAIHYSSPSTFRSIRILERSRT